MLRENGKVGIGTKGRKIVFLGLLTAVSLAMFLVEAQIPLPIPVPGVKLGLANIVTIFAVFALGAKAGVLVLVCRVFLGAVFSGNFASIFYAAAGGACAIVVTIGLGRLLTRRQIWVAGVLGAAAHAVGQMVAAILISGTPGIAIWLPAMVLCSMATGLLTGFCAQIVVNRGESLWKTISE